MATLGYTDVIACASKTKHEKETDNSRVSVTAVHCGNAAGRSGPTFVLLKGKTPQDGFTDKFMTDNGAAAGSQCIMTPNAFMTNDTWDQLAHALGRGIREMHTIKDHKTWWVRMTADGFGSHKFTLGAQEILREYRILLIIEEGDSSHVNQPFDRQVAKSGKASMGDTLELLRTSKALGPVLSQWALVHVVLAALRNIASGPLLQSPWYTSFKATNLNPKLRIPFPAWCEKIKGFLTAGSDFEKEVDIDRRKLLPAWWKVWDEPEKIAAIALVNEHDGFWGVELVKDVLDKFDVSVENLQDFRVCCSVEEECGSSVLGDFQTVPPPPPMDIDFTTPDVLDGLSLFDLKPPGMSGVDLFQHMCKTRRMSKNGHVIQTSGAVGDVDISAEQRSILSPSISELACGQILRESGGEGGKRKMAERRLNVLGEINNRCVVANSPGRVAKLKASLELAKSIDEIKRVQKDKKQRDSAARLSKLKEAAPAAISKYMAKENDASKLTINEMKATSFECLHKELKATKKSDVITEFKKLVEKLAWSPQPASEEQE